LPHSSHEILLVPSHLFDQRLLSLLATGSSYLFNARVRPQGGHHWQDVSFADVYTVRNGRVVEMQAFANRRQALRWVGAEAERDR
jgi:hypothetical protein